MAGDNVVPIEHQIPGRHRIEGTADLEIAYNRRGDDVVVRVNKRGVQILPRAAGRRRQGDDRG